MSSLLLPITIILFSAFLGGELFKRLFNVSRVLGQIFAGMVIGFFAMPYFQASSGVLSILSALGIVFLLLLTGIEADIKRMVKSGKEEAVIAFLGAMIPAVLGFVVMRILGYSNIPSFILGASLSLTAEGTNMAVLIEEKVLKTRIGMLLLGAGILDDFFEIIFLAIVLILVQASSLAETAMLPLHMLVFVVFVFLCFKTMRHVFFRVVDKYPEANSFMLILIFGLSVASISEFLGFGPIIGAFIAGIFIQASLKKHKIETKMLSDLKTVTFGLVVPFFFVFVGMNFDVHAILAAPALFAIILAVATFGKLAGALLASFSAKLKFQQAMLIGWGMNSRGAVELVIAEVAREANLISIEIYSAIVAMAILTTLMFPILLKFYLKRYPKIMDWL